MIIARKSSFDSPISLRVPRRKGSFSTLGKVNKLAILAQIQEKAHCSFRDVGTPPLYLPLVLCHLRQLRTSFVTFLESTALKRINQIRSSNFFAHSFSRSVDVNLKTLNLALLKDVVCFCFLFSTRIQENQIIELLLPQFLLHPIELPGVFFQAIQLFLVFMQSLITLI